MNRKTTVTIAIIVGLLFIGVVGWQLYQSSRRGTLEITVSPNDATVLVDNKRKEFAGSLELEAGSHTLEVARPNFQTQRFTVEIKKGETIKRDVFLTANNDAAAANWQNQNPAQARKFEAQAGKEITEGGAKVTADNPILNRLPYVTSMFRIDFGVSEKYPDDPHAVALYITGDGEAGKTKALDWMRSQGFDPDKFEIIYQEGGFGD